jgi:hypothetical protein
MRKLARRISVMAGAAFLAVAGGAAAGIGGTAADAAVTQTTFHMVRSAASVSANCLTGADATNNFRRGSFPCPSGTS